MNANRYHWHAGDTFTRVVPTKFERAEVARRRAERVASAKAVVVLAVIVALCVAARWWS